MHHFPGKNQNLKFDQTRIGIGISKLESKVGANWNSGLSGEVECKLAAEAEKSEIVQPSDLHKTTMTMYHVLIYWVPVQGHLLK